MSVESRTGAGADPRRFARFPSPLIKPDDEQRAKKKSHHTALRALAFKWMRILYRCWKDRQPYREDIYLASAAKRALLLQRLAKSVQMP